MNEFSWLIYAADVAGSLKGLGTFGLVGGLVGLGIFTVGKCIAFDTGFGTEAATPPIGVVYKRAAPFLIAFAVITFVVPSSGTIYAIAASEMGENVIKSKTGGKAVEALNAWLDRQIAGKPAA